MTVLIKSLSVLDWYVKLDEHKFVVILIKLLHEQKKLLSYIKRYSEKSFYSKSEGSLSTGVGEEILYL